MLLCAAFNAGAQKAAPAGDTVLKGATIEVVQSYKPQVKQVPKPEWVPQLPPNDTARPSFKYDVPVQTLYYSYSSLPIRPLALGIDSGKIPFENYVKLGGGNLSTIYLDAGIGGIYGPGYATSIHLHHISQQGNINYEQTALSGLEAEGMLYRQHNDWHASIDAERNQYYYYAYPDQEPKDTLKQTYTTIRASADMKNKDSADGRINYHPSVTASLYNARFGTSETTIGFNAPFTYNIDTTLQLVLGLNGKLTEFKSNVQNERNNYIELLPGVNFHLDELTGHALLGLAAGKNGGYVLPDVYLALPISGTRFIASAGWQATLLQNTYEQLTTENPYLQSTYQVMQSRKDQVFVNLEGNAGHHLFFSGRLSWNNWDELPTYSNLGYYGFNTVADAKRFYVIYQQVQAISFQAAARYKVANTWSAGICADFYNFYHSSGQHVWEQPEVKIKGDFMISPIPKLTVTAYLAVLGGVYAQYDYYQSVKLKTFTDIGGNAEYQIIPRLSAFVQVSNLLNDRYQRWIGYEAYGINVYGGLRLKF
jgi:hypothetical protein